MRDDQRCQIKLTHSSQRQGLTLYHLEINYHSQLYRLTSRYSKLRLFAMTLPQTNTPFPSPQHLEKIIASFLGNHTFLQKRLQKLQAYFDAVSSSSQLENSLGLKALVEESEKVQCDGEGEEHMQMPSAPKLKGKQLGERASDRSQMLVVF